MIGTQSGLITGILALFIFGVWYNQLVDFVYKHHLEHNALGYLVIGGFMAIGIVFGLLYGFDPAIRFAILAGGAGVPMIYGEIRREHLRQIKEKEDIKRRLSNEHPNEEMAE